MESARERWRERVRGWVDSELTAEDYAAEEGINARTLRYWKWRLGKEATSRPAFVEVTPRSRPQTERIEVVLEERFVVRVPATFAPATLRLVVAALTTTEDE